MKISYFKKKKTNDGNDFVVARRNLGGNYDDIAECLR